MSILNIKLLYRRSKGFPLISHRLLPDLAPGLTLNGSNYPYLEQIFMVPKRFEPLRFDCSLIWVSSVSNFSKPFIAHLRRFFTCHYIKPTTVSRQELLHLKYKISMTWGNIKAFSKRYWTAGDRYTRPTVLQISTISSNSCWSNMPKSMKKIKCLQFLSLKSSGTAS